MRQMVLEVVGDVDGSIRADTDSCGASPDVSIGVDEAGHEVFVGSSH